MSPEKRVGEIIALRTKKKANKALHLKVLTAVTSAFKEYDIEIEGDIIPDLIIGLPEEISNELSDVVLPGGTNC